MGIVKACMNENNDYFKRPTFTTAKNNMMGLKCYGGQTCAKIAQSGAGSDAVWETILISDGPWEI